MKFFACALELEWNVTHKTKSVSQIGHGKIDGSIDGAGNDAINFT